MDPAEIGKPGVAEPEPVEALYRPNTTSLPSCSVM
jgi:hypothetical protein